VEDKNLQEGKNRIYYSVKKVQKDFIIENYKWNFQVLSSHLQLVEMKHYH